MIVRWLGFSLAALALTVPTVPGEVAPTKTTAPVPGGIPLIGNVSTATLSAALRAHLVKAVPTIAYEKTSGWGKTTRALTGVKLKGIKGKYAEKNNGTWKKVRVTSPSFAEKLVVVLKDIREQESGAITFSLNLAFPVRIDYTQQKWVSGVKLLDIGVRARLEVAFALQCEATFRLEDGKGFLPDAVIHFRVLASNLNYDKLAVEHVAGLGGSAAKAIGSTILGRLKKWHPSLERHLLEKANAAIVKAGSNKEVRIGLDKLMKMKMKK